MSAIVSNMKKTTYYGNETTKALQNFPFTYPIVHKELIYAISEIKEAAAKTNKKIDHLSPISADAIVQACDEIRQGLFDNQFTLPGLQGGAGTSINMNVNEVIAGRAEEILKEKNTIHLIHPNDHVNKSQSTNDVNPSALKIACIRLTMKLIETADLFIHACETKAIEFEGIDKLGRTHLQDAVPTTLSEEFISFSESIKRDKQRIQEVLPYLFELNLGGTAIGNCINAPVEYRRDIYEELRNITKLPLKPADNFMVQTSSQTDFVMLSHAVVTLTLDLSKIASDLRLLSSGPQGGVGELKLGELQSGSSIMPGKVNPVLPETCNQLYFMVSGNNTTIEQAAHGAQLELGVMFPILADKLITSLKISSEVIYQFAAQCIPFIQANSEKCSIHLEQSTAYATLLTPTLGYDTVSSLVKDSLKSGKTIREIVHEKNLMPESRFNQLIHIHKSPKLVRREGK